MKITETELIEVLRLYDRARSTPVITFASDMPDAATVAWQRLYAAIARLGENYGCPGYGVNLYSGELTPP